MPDKKYKRDFKVEFLAGLTAGLSVQESIIIGELLKENEEESSNKTKKE